MRNIIVISFLFFHSLIFAQDVKIFLEVSLSKWDTNIINDVSKRPFCIDTDYVIMKLKFSCIRDTIIYFNFSTLEIVDMSISDKEEITNIKNVLKIDLRKFEYSDILLENKRHKFRSFAEGNMKPLTYEEVNSFHHMRDNKSEEIFLKGSYIILTDPFLRWNLKVNNKDKMIRLHYVFVPNEDLKDKGIKKGYIISSNWFEIDP